MKRCMGWMGAIVLAVTVPVGVANAATVTMTLDNINPLGPNTWLVTANASLGDNDGLAAVGVALTGGITSIDNVLPRNLTTTGSNIGFTLLRSPDGVNPIIGSQDTVTPTTAIVYGFGQVASDLTTEAIALGQVGTLDIPALTDQNAYGVPLLVATGT